MGPFFLVGYTGLGSSGAAAFHFTRWILNARASRARSVLLGGALLLLGQLPKVASADDTLAACVKRVVQSARSQKARPLGAPVVDFMLTGERDTYHFTLPEDGCLGLLAVGHRQVQHLGLTLFATSGRVLAQDEERDARAYTRFCGQAGRRFVAEVSMLDGQGEYHLVPLWDAPPALAALEPVMASCMNAGDRRPDLEDVGPEPLGRPLELEELAVAQELLPLGYRLESNVLGGTLSERRRELRRVILPAGRCFALAAIGDAAVEDIDMRLLSVGDSATLIAADVTRRRNAIVKVCPEEAGIYVLDVRMYRGSGRYTVDSFALVESGTAAPAGIEGSMRIPYAEMLTALAQRGMQAAPVTWGLLQPENTQSVPLKVRAGQCYGVGAIASSDFSGGDLDLMVVDEAGNLKAAEVGPNAHPMVFHCSDRDGLVHAVLKGREVHRSARFLLMLAEEVDGVEEVRTRTERVVARAPAVPSNVRHEGGAAEPQSSARVLQ